MDVVDELFNAVRAALPADLKSKLARIIYRGIPGLRADIKEFKLVAAAWISEANACKRMYEDPSQARAEIAEYEAEIRMLQRKIEDRRERITNPDAYLVYFKKAQEAADNRRKLLRLWRIAVPLFRLRITLGRTVQRLARLRARSIGVRIRGPINDK